MAEWKDIIKGAGLFFGGYFYIIIISYILPPLITAGETIYSGLEGMLWFFAILLFILITLIMPSIFIYRGVQTAGNREDKMISALIGILMFIFSMALTVKGWHFITTFAGMTSGIGDSTLAMFLTGLYWVGLIIAWLEITLITPAYLVIQALNN